MLRRLRLNNFVLFKGEHTLKFSDGAHYFIGPNESGKSSLFELVRRCLSTSMSTTLSTASDDDKPSLVCALFETKFDYQVSDGLLGHKKPDEKESGNQKSDEQMVRDGPQSNDKTSVHLESETQIKTLVGEETNDKASAYQKSDITSIVSALIKLPKSKKNEKKLYIKIACTTDKVYKGIDLVKENLMGIIVNEEYEVKPENELANEIIDVLMKYIKEEGDSTHLIDTIINLITDEEREKFLIKDVAVNKRTECNKLLKTLDDRVVNTFPNRGIGALQWSHSKLNTFTAKNSNYETAKKRFEIIMWFKESKNIPKNERDEEIKLYKLITGKDSKFEGGEHPLLKVPEGLVEAKICSILLAVSCFETVILEDPDRGMHPQMIERVRDLVLSQIKGKVVLVSSHHPYFVCSSNIYNMFLLRPIKYGSKIIPVGVILNSEKSPTKRGNMEYRLTTTDFRSVFFAERVIIVEGKWDVMFMESLKMTLLKNGCILMSKFQQDAFEEGIRAALSSLIILSADGKVNIGPLKMLCSKLQILTCSLKDNTQFKYKRGEQTVSYDKEAAETEITSDELAKQSSQDTGSIKKVYIWKTGELEDVFVNFSNWLWKTNHGKYKLFKNNLQKVLKCSEKDGKLFLPEKTGDKRDPKFGKTGSHEDRESVISTILEISGEEQLDDEDAMELLNFVKFLFDFLSSNQNARVKI